MGTELTQHEQDLRKIEEFRLLDDEFMTAVFNGATEEVSYILTVILGFKVTAVDVRTQYELKNLKGRSARLDIYAKDEMVSLFRIMPSGSLCTTSGAGRQVKSTTRCLRKKYGTSRRPRKE